MFIIERKMRQLTETQFKKPSGIFGVFTSNFMTKANTPKYEKIIDNMKINSGDKILEIGYGPGAGIKLIAEKFPSCNMYGVDFSKLMYRRATKLNKRFIDEKKVHLMLGDFVSQTFGEKGFDKIFFLNVLYFWNDLQLPFKKIRMLLKSNGELHFFMMHKDVFIKSKLTEIFNKYSIDEVVDTLKSAGFRNVTYFFERGYYIKALIN